MTKSGCEFVEFSLYDEILNGRLRPFFVDSFSDQEIKKILDELAKKILQRILKTPLIAILRMIGMKNQATIIFIRIREIRKAVSVSKKLLRLLVNQSKV